MHLNDDNLRAYLDAELGPVARLSIQEHLNACQSCAARLADLQQTAGMVDARMRHIAPPQPELFSPLAALHQFNDRRKGKMMKPIFRRPAFVMAGLVLVLAIALTFPPVQAIAGSFLGIFRAQQIRVISFDPAAIDRVNSSMESNQDRMQAFFKDNLTITRQGEFKKFTQVYAAANEAKFSPRLPLGSTVAALGVSPAQTMELKIDSALMNSVLESLGQTVQIPADLDGEKITASIPATVTVQFGDCPSEATPAQSTAKEPVVSNCKTLTQFASPTIDAPERFPVVQLGEAMLQVLADLVHREGLQ